MSMFLYSGEDPTVLKFAFTKATTLNFRTVLSTTVNVYIDFGNGTQYCGPGGNIPVSTSYGIGNYTVTIIASEMSLLLEGSEVIDVYLGSAIYNSLIFRSSANFQIISFGKVPDFSRITAMDYIFWGCDKLTTVPYGFFDKCQNVKSMSYAFGVAALPVLHNGWFDKLINVTDLNGCFFACNLTSVPAGLFDKCTNVTSFDTTFSSNPLSSIPVGLFDKCINVKTFATCFAGCYNLTGNAPDLWNKFPNANGTGCFSDCTKLSNYAQIPADWK